MKLGLRGLAFGGRGLGLWLGVIQRRKSPYFPFPSSLLLEASLHTVTHSNPHGRFQSPMSRPRQTHPIRALGGAWASEYFQDLRVTSMMARAERCHPGHFGPGTPQVLAPWYIEPGSGFSRERKGIGFQHPQITAISASLKMFATLSKHSLFLAKLSMWQGSAS